MQSKLILTISLLISGAFIITACSNEADSVINYLINKGDSRVQLLTRASINGGQSFISIMDPVHSDASILDGLSAEERDTILQEKLTYYDVLGYEDLIFNTNCARLLNNQEENFNNILFKESKGTQQTVVI